MVVLNCHGHYLADPVWSKFRRKVRYESDIEQIITQQEVESISVEEINQRIEKAFQYDEYKWQKENQIIIDNKNRASGLHKVLYQCPHCKAESKMDSDKHRLFCTNCGKQWEMTELGELKAVEGETEFSHIPDWYEWIRSNVAEEVHSGNYSFEDQVIIHSLPNPNGYINMGELTLQHSVKGFRLFGTLNDGTKMNFELPAANNYSLHIEYDYMDRGDCIDLSDNNHTYYLYPTKQNVVTKLHFAVEEIFKYIKPNIAVR